MFIDILEIKGGISMLEFLIIEELGFKKEEVDAIKTHFLCRLDQEDWESIELVKDELEDAEGIEDSENYLKLPTGRIAYFPDDLLHKEILAQID